MSDLLELLEIIEAQAAVIEHQQKEIKKLAEELEMLREAEKHDIQKQQGV